ncbi:MAG: phenol hydroxylase subunit [Ilumatobacteraceae bacterium]|nr:phenol hydroxylase [Acidimicrobiaceae bacterium]
MPEPRGFDTTRRFVRVVERRPDGFVEFHFSIGDPSLFVEMLLSETAFDEFCASIRPETLGPLDQAHADPLAGMTEDEPDDAAAAFAWTMHDATHRRIT